MAVITVDEENKIEVDNQMIAENLERIVNQIFRLLPCREEGEDWIKPLETLTVEISGLDKLLASNPKTFSLLCKLKGMKELTEESDFMLFRRTVFETCGIVDALKGDL